jgi:hypothetical protein
MCLPLHPRKSRVSREPFAFSTEPPLGVVHESIRPGATVEHSGIGFCQEQFIVLSWRLAGQLCWSNALSIVVCHSGLNHLHNTSQRTGL